MPIKPPDDPDAQLECEFQLEPGFQALIDSGVKMGWDGTLVARAVRSLAANHLLAREANAETDSQIAATHQPNKGISGRS